MVGGFLVALPLVDRGPERAPRRRVVWLGALAGLLAAIAGLTVVSLARDAGDPELDARQAKAAMVAGRARAIAKTYGVPASGARDLWHAPPMQRARELWAERCAGCHEDGPDRKGPLIARGHGDRAWLTAFLKDPSGDAFWGRTKLAKAEAAMKPVELEAEPLADLVELLYAESGAADVDEARRARGAQVFDDACTDCHSRDEGAPGAAGPGLAGLGSRDYYRSFISNPKSALHMGPEHAEMPRFDRELSLADRDALAEYLVWLRTATARDLAELGPL